MGALNSTLTSSPTPDVPVCDPISEDPTPLQLALASKNISTPVFLRKQDNKTHALENKAVTPLLRLLIELWLHIARYLDGSAILAWRQTCTTARSILPDPALDDDNCKEFRYLLGLDRILRFPALYERERKAPMKHVDKALCSTCLAPHLKRYFTGGQLVLDPSERACIKDVVRGSTIPLCEHSGLSYIQLQQIQRYLLKRQPTAWFDFFASHSGIHPCTDPWPCLCGKVYAPRCKLNSMDELLLYTEKVIVGPWPLGFQLNATKVLDTLISMLQDDNHVLCPHLQKLKHPAAIRHCAVPQKVALGIFASIVCPDRSCDTKVCFSMNTSGTVGRYGSWTLSVRRNLGRMNDVFDPTWLAQLDKRHLGFCGDGFGHDSTDL